VRHRIVVLAIVLALALVVGTTPAGAGELSATYWTEWMSSTLLAYDGVFDTTPDSYYSPDVQGDWVVWQKTGDSAVDWNIYAYNLKTRTVEVVCEAAGMQTAPRVYGDWVVYYDNRWGNQEVYAYNLAANTEKRLTNRAGNQEFPDISGTKVVYTDSADHNLYVYDLARNTDTKLPLYDGTNSVSFARISGSRIAYTRSNDIWVYDMTIGTPPVRITNDSGVGDYAPDIDGTLIAWMRGDPLEIWTYDLADEPPTAQLAVSLPDYLVGPRVCGRHVVFSDAWSGHGDVGIYDQSRDEYEMLTDSASNDDYASIDGLNIVYTSGDGTAGEYGGNISLGRLVAPSISIRAAASTVNYGGKTTLSGSMSENGIALGNKPIKVDRSTNGGHTWSEVASIMTDSSGAYSYLTQANHVKAFYRVRFNGDSGPIGGVERFSGQSRAVSVTPRAYVGTPAGYPSSGNDTKTYSVYGTLKPHQAVTPAADGVVTIKCYRKQSGHYVLRRTFKAKVYDYETYSRYRASVRLPYTGRWRMKAYFKGSSKSAAKYSAYKYVNVY